MKKTRADNIRGYRIDYACNTVYLNYTLLNLSYRRILLSHSIIRQKSSNNYITIDMELEIVRQQNMLLFVRNHDIIIKNQEDAKMDMDTLGFFLFMEEQEEKAQQQREESNGGDASADTQSDK